MTATLATGRLVQALQLVVESNSSVSHSSTWPPAFPYVKAGPIAPVNALVAYREWLVVCINAGQDQRERVLRRELCLFSTAFMVRWSCLRPMEAKVPLDHSTDNDKYRRLAYGNGIYAWRKRFERATETASHYECRHNIVGGVCGSVYLWGEIIEHEDGYRAQYAYPKALHMSLPFHQNYPSKLATERDFLHMCKAYHVEVVDSPEQL